MAENKTRPTPLDPNIAEIRDDSRRRDVETLDALLYRLSGSHLVMWGTAIFGYGTCNFSYASGRNGEFLRCGFASRSRDLVVYLMSGFDGLKQELDRLGPHKTVKCCLYLKRLDAIDLAVLERVLTRSLAFMAERYPVGHRAS